MKLVGRAIVKFLKITGVVQILEKRRQPRSIWGYHDRVTGEFRKLTRVSNTAILYQASRISMEDNVFVGHYCVLDGTGGLHIGRGTQIAALTGIFSHSSHAAIRLYGDQYTEVSENDKVGYFTESVNIGNYVYIGSGSKILPGIQIADFAVVAAAAVVTKNVDRYCIVAGNPARVIGDVRDKDAELLKQYPELQETYVVK